MSLGLHNLKSNHGATHRTKRLGRGNASGHGTYSTRGQKGQKARTGGSSGLKRKGFRHILLSIPKKRGFNSIYSKSGTVNLGQLDKSYKDGETVNMESILTKKLIANKPKGRIKVLGTGELTKKLIFQACDFSASAKEKVVKAGGTIN